MARQIIEFTTDKRFVRRARELKTIETMVRMYCRGHRHERGGRALCSDCAPCSSTRSGAWSDAYLAMQSPPARTASFIATRPTCASRYGS